MKKNQENISGKNVSVFPLSASPSVGIKLRALMVLGNIPTLSYTPSTILWVFDRLLFFFLFDSGGKKSTFFLK